MRLFKYFDTKTVVLSLIIVIFTIVSINLKSEIKNIPLWWESTITIVCAIVFTLINLEPVFVHSKSYDKYQAITKGILLMWYFLLTIVGYGYIVSIYL